MSRESKPICFACFAPTNTLSADGMLVTAKAFCAGLKTTNIVFDRTPLGELTSTLSQTYSQLGRGPIPLLITDRSFAYIKISNLNFPECHPLDAEECASSKCPPSASFLHQQTSADRMLIYCKECEQEAFCMRGLKNH